MRNLDTVNNDGRVLREEGVDSAGEILLIGGVDDVVLGPLSEGRKDDGSGHGC